ncbi:hypothetical protein GCM10027275_22870 [Rhabdobacter roseus]|uniref:Uncharacterized protein n=1 Tax=Rhabdobacter roseus TaxID=1655419 RepID=A0A840TMQ8_9BACT|nr:hypothetical protein [Rhabdobacter roseus]MBB5284225.1 hypothetical protein [Rhabdobacter roseus]
MFQLFQYFYVAILTLCLGTALYHWKQLDATYRWLKYLVAITWLVEAWGFYHLWHLKKVAHGIFHGFTPIEYALLALYFAATIRNGRVKQLIYVSILLHVVLSVLNTIFFQPIQGVNSNSFLLMAFFLVAWALFYFYEMYLLDEPWTVYRNPDFWVATGVLFFYGGSFFVMGLIELVRRYDLELARQLYIINLILNMAYYSLLIVGFKLKIGTLLRG